MAFEVLTRFHDLSPEFLHVYVEFGGSLASDFVEPPLVLDTPFVHLLASLDVFHLLFVQANRIASKELCHGLGLSNLFIFEEGA